MYQPKCLNRIKARIKRSISAIALVFCVCAMPLSIAQAANASASQNSVAAVIHGVVKTFVDLMFELNPFLPSTIQDNALFLATKANADKTTAEINDNSINYALTGFVGFRDLGKPAKPGDGSDTEKYLKFLKDKSGPDFLSTEEKPDTVKPIEDIFSFYRDQMGVISDKYQKKEFKKFMFEEAMKSPLKASSMMASVNRISLYPNAEKKNLKPSQKLDAAFAEYLKAKKLCPPFPEDKDGGHPKCKLTKENEEFFKQKFMYEVFFGNNNQPAEYTEGNKYYNINTLMNPLAYTDAEEKAAGYLLKNLEKSIELPPMQPAQIPQPLTEKQFKAVVKQLTDPDLKYNPMDRIVELQHKYTDVTRALLINRSILMNNFYRIYAKRLEDQAVLSSSVRNTKNERMHSEQELSAYLANRRLNAQWYKAMSEAPPSTIERETLFVLAEMRQQMFEQQKQMEHVLLTLSVMALSQMKSQKSDVGTLNAQIQREIDEFLKGSSKQNEAIKAASEGNSESGEDAASSITDSADANVQPPQSPGDE